MLSMSIQSDLRASINALEAINEELPYLQKKVLRATASKIKSKVKKAFQSSFKHGPRDPEDPPGKMSFYSKAKNNFRAFVRSNQQYKMQTLEFGRTIVAEDKKWLVYKTYSGSWVKVKKVTIQPKPFFFETANDFLDSQEFRDTVSKITEKEIEKAIRKRANK